MKKKTAFVISGGILNPPFLHFLVQKEKPDYVVVADAGLCVCKLADVWPDCIVGDFDSVEQSVLAVYQGKTKNQSYILKLHNFSLGFKKSTHII